MTHASSWSLLLIALAGCATTNDDTIASQDWTPALSASCEAQLQEAQSQPPMAEGGPRDWTRDSNGVVRQMSKDEKRSGSGGMTAEQAYRARTYDAHVSKGCQDEIRRAR